jgi:maleylpyruvate isomerase
MRPEALIKVCGASHQHLLADLASLTDDDLRLPSLLPRYSRGHVVAHLINKVRAHVELVGGPPADEVRTLHPEGYDPDAAADEGADRTAIALRTDLEQAFRALEAAWDVLEADMWDREAVVMAGPRALREVVRHHLRNVEVHHVDLDIGHLPKDWPSVFVDGELRQRLRTLPDRADHTALLAWLLDRAPAPKLRPW